MELFSETLEEKHRCINENDFVNHCWKLETSNIPQQKLHNLLYMPIDKQDTISISLL